MAHNIQVHGTDSKAYVISLARQDMDIDVIHNFLSASYWAQGIARETVANAVANSYCAGLFTSTDSTSTDSTSIESTSTNSGKVGEQVGFARAITDATTFAYLADVFVLDKHRGKGLAQALISHMLGQPQLQGLRRIMLATSDAHGLYKKLGFTPLSHPNIMMEKWDPEVYFKV